MNNMYDYLMTRNYGMRKQAGWDPATESKMREQKAALEAKKNKSSQDIVNLNYLRRQLKPESTPVYKNTKPLDIAIAVANAVAPQTAGSKIGETWAAVEDRLRTNRAAVDNQLRRDRKRAEADRQSAKDLADLLYTGGAGLGGLAAGGAAGYALSKENKLRNAIISGLVTGAIAGGGTYALRKYMK